MTLLVLALAAAAMTDLTRRSVGQVLAANAAEGALQQRWAATSCRATFLSRAGLVIDGVEQRSRQPTASARADFALGDGAGRTPVTLLFGDEDAKLNVNALYERDRGEARAALGKLAGPLKVRLRPSPPSRDEAAGPALAFESFGQVFDAPPPAALFEVSGGVTLWGDARLNFRRADAAGLSATLRPLLGRGEIDRLIRLRGTPAGRFTGSLFDALKLPQRDRDAAEARLTPGSSTFSLWIVTGDARSRRYRLAVQERTTARGNRTLDFAW